MSFAVLLKLVALVLALVAASVMARRGRTPGRGIALGTTTGLVAGYGFLQLVHFISYVLPMGQIDFWLAAQINRITG